MGVLITLLQGKYLRSEIPERFGSGVYVQTSATFSWSKSSREKWYDMTLTRKRVTCAMKLPGLS